MRLIPKLRGISYVVWLKKFNLTTLEDRRTKGDMVTYKILRGRDKEDRDRLFERWETATQGHS